MSERIDMPVPYMFLPNGDELIAWVPAWQRLDVRLPTPHEKASIPKAVAVIVHTDEADDTDGRMFLTEESARWLVDQLNAAIDKAEGRA
jgi:hypothetical protein